MSGYPTIPTPASINVKDFGAIGDDNSHPLSQRYQSLAQAQLDYPFATSLQHEIDGIAIQAAIWSVGQPEAPRGATVFIPRGIYRCSDDLHISRQLVLMGAGRGNTQLSFAPGKGIIVHNQRTSPDGGTGEYSTITNMDIKGNRLTTLPKQWEAGRPYQLGDTVVPAHDNRFYYECIKPGTSKARETAAAWTSGQNHRLGEVVRPSRAILFRCQDAGQSGGEEPIWDLNPDAKTKDGAATWKHIPTPEGPPPVLAPWAPGLRRSQGDIVRPTDRFSSNLLFECSIAGQGFGAEPFWTSPPLDAGAGCAFEVGGVFWERYPRFPFTPDTSRPWQPSKKYKVGDMVRSAVFDPANPGNPNPQALVIFECTKAGTSASGPGEPAFVRVPNDSLGQEVPATVTDDNGVHWTCRRAFAYWLADGGVIWACRLAAGIWMRAHAYVHNVTVEGFHCASIHIQSQRFPVCNANGWHLNHVFCGSSGAGIVVTGDDSNAGVGIGLQVVSIGFAIPGNGGFGIFDRGESNTWIGGNVEACTGRAYVGARGGIFLGCYSEDALPSYMSIPSMSLGGAQAAGLAPFSKGWRVPDGYQVAPHTVINPLGANRIETYLGINDGSGEAFGWKVDGEADYWRLRWYDNEKVWATQFSASPVFRAAYVTGGRQGTIHVRGLGLQGFPSFLLGTASDNIKMTKGNEVPTSGTWQRGDCIINADPKPGDPRKGGAGWICVEGSSAAHPFGVWHSFGAIATQPAS
jgi:hypothetical protein